MSFTTSFRRLAVTRPTTCNRAADENEGLRGRRTYTPGTVNSVPLLRTGRKSIDFLSHFDDLMSSANCTKLHKCAPIFSQILRGLGETPYSHNWGGAQAPPRGAHPPPRVSTTAKKTHWSQMLWLQLYISEHQELRRGHSFDRLTRA